MEFKGISMARSTMFIPQLKFHQNPFSKTGADTLVLYTDCRIRAQ